MAEKVGYGGTAAMWPNRAIHNTACGRHRLPPSRQRRLSAIKSVWAVQLASALHSPCVV